MKNVKEYLEKAYAAAMYEELHQTAEFIELAIEALSEEADFRSSNGRSDPLAASMTDPENVVAFPIESSK